MVDTPPTTPITSSTPPPSQDAALLQNNPYVKLVNGQWISNNPNTAEQAAAQNAAYNAGVPYYDQPGRDSAMEAAKAQLAFSQPRNDLAFVPSANYLAIVGQYNAVQGAKAGITDPSYSYNPVYYNQNSAAGIAAMQASRGGAVNPYLAATAISEGYSGPITLPTMGNQIDYGRSVVAPPLAASLFQSPVMDVYVPYGSYAQTRIENAKVLMDFNTGELGIYQQPYGRSTFNLVGGGSRGSLQSGMFTFGQPETPYVIPQEKAGQVTLPAGTGLSRLGAEAYGGFVLPLDNRTVQSTNAQLSTYSNPYNLANYVNPQGVNTGKVAAPGAAIPWEVGNNTPSARYMDAGGIVGIYNPSSSPFAASAAEQLVLPAPFKSTAGVAPPKEPTFFEDVGNFFKNAPILGAVYSAGASVDQGTKDRVASIVSTTPVLESVYRGGNVFELKSDYEKIAATTERRIFPMITDYTAKAAVFSGNVDLYTKDVGVYQSNLNKYESNLSVYNSNKTESGYTALLAESSLLSFQKNALDVRKSSLDLQQSKLDVQKLTIDTALRPAKEAETKYNVAAGNLVGNVDQKSLATYGVGTWFRGLEKGYGESVVTPIRSYTSGWGAPGQFITGVAEVPGQLAYIGQTATMGGETIIRDLPSLPGIAAAGVGMQLKGTYEMATTNPAGLIGNVAGMFAVGYGVHAVGSKTVGVVRTAGMDYVPLENIGYGPEGRYPLNPAQSEPLLSQSFAEGRLYPRPTQMAEGGPVPYLHGENGVPLARLPNAVANGETTLWTALDSSSRSRFIGVGEAYRLETSGGSEVNGLYGAPVLESYFAKVGGIIPRMVGVDMPFKTPTMYSTITQGVEAIPEAIRRTARTGDYTSVNEYIRTRSTEVPAGQGYMPLLKAEYEAIIPDDTIIAVTGRNYYTRIGGLGDNHLLGTRVPIVEQEAIGFIPRDVVTNIPTGNLGESYKSVRPINPLYSALSQHSSTIQLSKVGSSEGSSKRTSANSVSSITPPKEYRGYPSRASSYAKPSSLGYESSRSPSSVSRISSSSRASSSVSAVPESSVIPYKSISPVSGISRPYSLPSPVVTPPTYPKYTQPTYPKTPGYTPPSGSSGPVPPPPIPIPGLFPDFGGTGAASPFSRKRKKSFKETFSFGLDYSVKARSKRQGKSFTSPKKKPVRKKK